MEPFRDSHGPSWSSGVQTNVPTEPPIIDPVDGCVYNKSNDEGFTINNMSSIP